MTKWDFSYAPCLDALNTTTPCPAACQTQLAKLPQACLNRLVTSFNKNATMLTAVEAQLGNCTPAFNYTILLTNAGASRFATLAVPLAVLAFSIAAVELLL